MQTKDSYLKLNSDGSLKFVTEISEDRDLTPQLCKLLSEDVLVKSPTLFLTSGGSEVGTLQSLKEAFLFTWLPKIRFNCPFHAGTIMTPEFVPEANTTNPVLNIDWSPPEGMRILFLSRMTRVGTRPTILKDDSNWLFAMNAENQSWQLPLPNLFDDCKICMGAFNGQGDTFQQSFQAALDQFDRSSWNADLLANKQARAGRLFMFKATETGFEQVPQKPGDKWEAQCIKVATSISKMTSIL